MILDGKRVKPIDERFGQPITGIIADVMQKKPEQDR